MTTSAKPIAPYITQNVNLLSGDVPQKRQEIRAYFLSTFDLYETLFESLRDDTVFYARPQPLRHPLIFYFGHTAVFFVNKLMLAKQLTGRVDERMESIFAIGVDEMSWDDLNDKNYDWPSVADVRAYRQKVRNTVLGVIDRMDFTMPVDWKSPMWPVMMGIEHERIHLETSSVLIRQLDISKVREHPLFQPCPFAGEAPENVLIPVKGGQVELGKSRSHHLYGWDNEFGHATLSVSDFEASRFLVSNQEYLQFMEAGGYTTDEWWDEEGLAWKRYHNAQMPEFWKKGKDGLVLRLMTREVPLPLNWPVEVCYLEAKAFCNWKSSVLNRPVRMPDEGEYRRLLQVCSLEKEHCDTPIDANWNLEHFAGSMPVDTFFHGDFCDVVGNVWQWNETPIYGFDGFEVHPLYDDFSTPTFDNRHAIIKGGSWISTGNEIALHSRYAFRRHFYQHSGFRYVVSDKPVKKEFSTYETDAAVAMYLEAHYGRSYFGVPNFAKTIAQIALRQVPENRRGKALDIGCATGRLSFELSPYFEQVDGLDFSARFIRQAIALAKEGRTRYELVTEGELVEYRECALADLGVNVQRDRITFMQQDACNMKPQYRGYDLVVAANLVDRLTDPVRFLLEIGHRMNDGGILVIASPFTWMTEFTAKEKWLGGFKKDGEPVTALDGLHHCLDQRFALVAEPLDVPFVIRETARKFQHTLSQVTLWRKK
ncbi:MAG: 5-histidylcysteine sulfoxide synthase [Deltaproteobacteria bacterium]|nr:5-histidylcysteine sulfoxide synthase [Deltaproteobacteria bacterium]